MNISRFLSIGAVVSGLVIIGTGYGVPLVTTPGTPKSMTLVRDGQPAATIVLAQEPNRAAALAAVELQEHILKITGAKVSIVTDDRIPAGVRILVGESAATRKLGLQGADFKPQEYLIRTYPDTLVLMGRDKLDPILTNIVAVLQELPLPNLYDDQATCYAVYDFLERFCGVRWFNPTDSGTICPQTKTLAVNVSAVRRAPAFEMRVANMTYGDYEIRDAGIDTLWSRGTDGYKTWETAAYAEIHKHFPDAGQYGGPYALAKRRAIKLFMHRMRLGGKENLINHSLNGTASRIETRSGFFISNAIS